MTYKRKLIYIFIILIIIVDAIRIFVGEPCYVPSPSMEPTIKTGDWLWMDKATYGAVLPVRFADIPLVNVFTWIPFLREADAKNDWGYHRFYSFSKPAAGDVVVFNNPDNKGGLLVKRIASIINKGDSLSTNIENYDLLKDILSKEGKNITTREQYIYIEDTYSLYYVLTQDYYYMIGDNYNNSSDSRDYGYIPEKSIIGKINRVIFSLEHDEKGNSSLRKDRFFHKIE